MDSANAALIFSALSLAISVLAFGWGIYKEVALRARVRLYFGVYLFAIGGSSEHTQALVTFDVYNHGPGPVRIQAVVGAKRRVVLPLRSFFRVSFSWRSIWRWLRNGKYSHVVRIFAPHHDVGRLPLELAPGEQGFVTLPYGESCVLNDGWDNLGLADTYGRFHWLSPKQLQKARDYQFFEPYPLFQRTDQFPNRS